MTHGTNNAKSPETPVSDRSTVEQMYRGVCQEIEGLKEQLQGKRQQKSALERHLGREKEYGS